MLTQIIISFCLLVIAGTFKALMDQSAEGRFKKLALNKGFSFYNKWRLDEHGNRIGSTSKKWYYLFVFTPQYQEKFYLSSSLLAFVTDAWHLFQFFCFNSIYLAVAIICIPYWLLAIKAFLFFKLAVSLSFAVVRRFVLKTKV